MQEGINYPNRPIPIKGIETIINNLPNQKAQGSDEF